MAILSDDRSVFGDSVPSIYVKKVTVENSGFVTNPHLADRIVAHVDNKAATGVPGADFFEQFYEQSNFTTTTTGKSIKLTVNYLVKDGLDGTLGELLSTWSGEEDLQNYTSVMFYLVDNSLAAKLLSVGSNIASAAGDKNLYYAVGALAEYKMLNDDDIQQLASIGYRSETFEGPYTGVKIKKGTSKRQITQKLASLVEKSVVHTESESLNDILQQTKLSTYVEIDDSGKRIKNYEFYKTYEYKSDSPKDLFIVSACIFNIFLLSNLFDLDMSFLEKNGIPTGRRATQQIFQNGKIATTNCIYLLKSNSAIWTGQTYRIGSKFYTAPNVADGEELVKQNVQNNKIQDFRITERIEKLKFNLSFLQTDSIALSEAKKVTRDTTDVFKQPAYFTKNYMSRDFAGNARFMFGVDYYSLVRDLTNFGGILPKQVNPESLINSRLYSQVLSLSIKRKRVDLVPRTNKLGTGGKAEVPFKTGYLGEPHIDVEEIIATVSEGSEQLNLSGIGVFATNKSSNLNGLEEVSFRAPDLKQDVGFSGFRFFNADDLQIKNFTDGYYQYGVELSILDRSNDYIINKVINLIKAYKLVSQYYNLAIIPNKFYNPRTGAFMAALKQYYNTQELKPWTFAIGMLSEIIKEFKSDDEVFQQLDFKKQMELVCHPNTGTPRGIEALQKLLLNAASKLAEIAGTALNRSTLSELAAGSTKTATKSSVLSKAAEKRIIKVEYWLEDIFDTEVPKQFGYDFLTPTGDSSTALGRGLLNISGQDFNTRLRNEMLKYYKVDSPSSFEITNQEEGIQYTPNDTIFESLFSFLSPSAINLGTVFPGGNTSDVTGKKSFSLLDANTPFGGSGNANPFYDKEGYSYVASKIINYNNNAILPPYDTTLTSQTDGGLTLLSQATDKIKYHTQQTLVKRNCIASIDNVQESKTNSSNFKGLFMSEYLGEEIDNADPLENNNIKLDDLVNNPENISYKGGAEVSVFLTFMYGYGNQCGGIASTKAPATTTNKAQSNFSLDFFNTTIGNAVYGPKNIISAIKSILGVDPGEFYAIGVDGVAPLPIQNNLKALPNQIKSLLLQQNADARVRHKWINVQDEPSQNVYYKGALALNYMNLKQVEYLAGYEYGQEPIVTTGPDTGFMVSAPSRPMIRRPIWKVLDADVYTAAINKKLFCRLRTYSKSEFGIVPLDCLELPVFDEYFTLEPASYDGLFVPAQPLEFEPESSTTIQDEQPSEYADSGLNIKKPSQEQMKQMDDEGIITGGASQKDAIKEDLPQMGGFLGGKAGGPRVDTQTGNNMTKI